MRKVGSQAKWQWLLPLGIIKGSSVFLFILEKCTTAPGKEGAQRRPSRTELHQKYIHENIGNGLYTKCLRGKGVSNVHILVIKQVTESS